MLKPLHHSLLKNKFNVNFSVESMNISGMFFEVLTIYILKIFEKPGKKHYVLFIEKVLDNVVLFIAVLMCILAFGQQLYAKSN